MDTEVNKEQQAESRKQQAESTKPKVEQTPEQVLVEFLQGSANAGLTKKMYYATAVKLEATGKVRIIK